MGFSLFSFENRVLFLLVFFFTVSISDYFRIFILAHLYSFQFFHSSNLTDPHLPLQNFSVQSFQPVIDFKEFLSLLITWVKILLRIVEYFCPCPGFFKTVFLIINLNFSIVFCHTWSFSKYDDKYGLNRGLDLITKFM